MKTKKWVNVNVNNTNINDYSNIGTDLDHTFNVNDITVNSETNHINRQSSLNVLNYGSN